MLFLRGGRGASRSESSSDFEALGRRWWSCRWAKPLVAVVLLVAAGLKAHELATVPVAVVSGGKALAGDPTCGCFGRVPTSPWLSLSINMAAILGLVGERIMATKSMTPAGNTRGRDGSNAANQWLGTAWLVTAVVLLVVTVNERASADLPGIGTRVGDFVIVEPERMLDGPFALGEHIDIGDRLASGRWLVVLYRADCPACQSLLEELTAIQSQWNQWAQMAWICVGTAPSPKQSLEMTGADPQWLQGTMSEQINWFVTVPLLIALDENQVLAASSALEGSFRDLVNGAWGQSSPTEAESGRLFQEL